MCFATSLVFSTRTCINKVFSYFIYVNYLVLKSESGFQTGVSGQARGTPGCACTVLHISSGTPQDGSVPENLSPTACPVGDNCGKQLV